MTARSRVKLVYDWRDLRIFVAVAREGSTLAASRRLGMNQTTVARRIAALESTVRLQLFEKLQRGYRLTKHGAELLPYAERVQKEAEGFLDVAVGRARRVYGEIRVTTNEPLANLFLTPALPDLMAEYPELKIQMVVEDRYLDVGRGEADVAIRSGTRPSDPDLVVRTIAKGAWSFYCSRSYAERNGAPTSLEELRHHELLGVEGSIAVAPALQFIAQDGASRFKSYSNHLTNHMVAIKSGLGVGPLPCLIGDAEEGLIRCFPPPTEFDADILLITRAELRNLPHMRAFSEFVVSRIAALRPRLSGCS